MKGITNYEKNIIEIRELIKEIINEPLKLFEMLRIDMKKIAEEALTRILQEELTLYLGREKYERVRGAKNYRNGFRKKKYLVKHLGEIELKILRDRNWEFKSEIIKNYERREKSIAEDVALMFFSGMSTRGIELLSKRLIGQKISRSEVSKMSQRFDKAIEQWRTRD